MPSRYKTRKLQYKKQKGGAGFFSVASKPTRLPYESYASSINRVYTFLYSKIKTTTPGYLPLQVGQKILSSEQKNFFRSLLDSYKISNSNASTYRDDDFVRDILGVDSIQTLNRQIQQVEAANTEVQNIVLNRPAIAQSFAGSWGRFLPVIFASEKQLEYRQDWEQNICTYDSKVDQNRSITSLNENRCILIYHNKADFPVIESQFQLVYGDSKTIGPGLPFLLVEKEYLPEMNGLPFPYTNIHASKLMKTSFVLDALINNGVKEIQANLAETIEKEQKRLWNQYSLVKIVNHRQLNRHDIYNQKFISVVDEFSSQPGNYFLLPNLSSLDQVKGMDVQSSLQFRVRYPRIWSTLGSDPNLDFFIGLNYPDQIRFAVLQFKQFVKILRTSPDTAFRTVFLTDLRSIATKELFLRNIEADEIEKYRALLNRHR